MAGLVLQIRAPSPSKAPRRSTAPSPCLVWLSCLVSGACQPTNPGVEKSLPGGGSRRAGLDAPAVVLLDQADLRSLRCGARLLCKCTNSHQYRPIKLVQRPPPSPGCHPCRQSPTRLSHSTWILPHPGHHLDTTWARPWPLLSSLYQ